MDTKIDEVRRQLRSRAQPVNPGYSYWIGGNGREEFDPGLSYCKACGEKHIAELNEADADGEYFLDGGWPQETDSSFYCETCGATLDVDLTEYAVSEELSYWKGRRLREHLLGVRGPWVAYRMLQILEGILAMEETATTRRFLGRLQTACSKPLNNVAV